MTTYEPESLLAMIPKTFAEKEDARVSTKTIFKFIDEYLSIIIHH